MLVELRSMGVSLETAESGTLVAAFHVRPVLVDRVRDLQAQDPYLMKLRSKIEAGRQSNFTLRGDGTLVLGQRLCVPDVIELKKEIMEEAHSSAYAMHPGSTKMFRTLKDHYWWRGMKREIAEFVSKCLTCQQIKIEHQKSAGLLQPLSWPNKSEIDMAFHIKPHRVPSVCSPDNCCYRLTLPRVNALPSHP